MTTRPHLSPEPLAARSFPRPFGPKYVLLKEIGAGGMGRVYMAVSGDAGMQRLCAVKTILHDKDEAEDDDERLQRRLSDEDLLATKFSHENLVCVFDASRLGRESYFAMEFISGKPLSRVQERCAERAEPLPLGLAMYVTQELCAALGYVHGFQKLGLIHRDVSPGNVMLSYTGGVKLIDFGIAKWTGNALHTTAGLTWGKNHYKNHYMSPEQHLGRPVDQRSDIFSAGILFWEMLAGRALFPGDAARPLAPQIPRPSEFNSVVPGDLDRIALRALAAEPRDRFGTADEFGAAVAQFLAAGSHKRKLAQFLGALFAQEISRETAEQETLTRAAGAQHLPAPVPVLRDATPQPPEPALIGQILGDRYEVRRMIGSGSMGHVYEGFHRGIGKRVAIKVPRTGGRDGASRFHREANAPAQIGHVNIAGVTDSGTTPDGFLYYVMEYLDGPDLEQLVQRDGPLPIDRVVRIGIQICEGVDAAHKAGIIHRDLKPSNVMLVPGLDGETAKIVDFGVAKFAQGADMTKPQAPVGTPRYMAPEQIEVGGVVDARTDVYAVGGILYELLSGRAPYDGDDAMEVCRKKLDTKPVSLRQWRPEIPEKLDNLVLRCLAAPPTERPQSAADLARALAVGREKAAPVRTPRPFLRSARNSQVPWIVAASVFVLVVALVAILAGRHDPGAASSVGPAPPSAAVPLAPVKPAPPPTLPPPVRVVTKRPLPAPVTTVRRAATEPARPEPAKADVLVAEGEAAFRKGRLLESLVFAKKAINAGGGVRALLLAGVANLGMDELDEAKVAFEAALAHEPNNEVAQRGLDEISRRRP